MLISPSPAVAVHDGPDNVGHLPHQVQVGGEMGDPPPATQMDSSWGVKFRPNSPGISSHDTKLAILVLAIMLN